MRQRCEYCGGWIDDADEVCPNCGAANSHLMVSGTGEPKTIADLREFCQRHNLPLQKMRFFIGEDYKEPKAFGIYEDADGNFVVYKNKANGERAVRYRGKDEAYAVNELYQKMKSEVANQKKHLGDRKEQHAKQEVKKKRWGAFLGGFGICAVIALLMTTCVGYINSIPNNGYYNYGTTQYYHTGGDWWRYDDTDSEWYRESNPPSELHDDYESYWQGYDYDSDSGTTEFVKEDHYDYSSSGSSDDDDWDSWDDDWDDDDWSWDDDDSWDSDYTDWDTDW